MSLIGTIFAVGGIFPAYILRLLELYGKGCGKDKYFTSLERAFFI